MEYIGNEELLKLPIWNINIYDLIQSKFRRCFLVKICCKRKMYAISIPG